MIEYKIKIFNTENKSFSNLIHTLNNIYNFKYQIDIFSDKIVYSIFSDDAKFFVVLGRNIEKLNLVNYQD